MNINGFGPFIITWFGLYFIIFGLNFLFTNEQMRKKRIEILENAIVLNPFFLWFYKIMPATGFNASGLSIILIGIFIMGGFLAKIENNGLSNFNLLVCSFANYICISAALYIIWRLILAIERKRLTHGFFYHLTVINLSSVPQLAIVLLFIIFFIYHILILYKCLNF